ncbi:MAG: RsmE family RNA methyltransferase [Ignavibacteria bacterium]
MEYYYTPKSLVFPEKQLLHIEDFEYKHLVKVLRKRIGDEINVTDGEGNIYKCRIDAITKTKIIASIEDTAKDLYELAYNLIACISPLRNPSRFEFEIEKSVELGVKKIIPVVTERTVVKEAFEGTKFERYRKIIITAMGQSMRCVLPEMSNKITLEKLIEETTNEPNRIVFYEFAEDEEFFKPEPTSKNIFVLIGPEGGFSDKEINLLRLSGWKVNSLGERKVRSETAAILALYNIIKKLNS